MLAIIIVRNAGNKCYQLENPEILATTVSNYSFPEMLAIYASNNNFKKCWRHMLAIPIPRNAGNNNYNYDF